MMMGRKPFQRLLMKNTLAIAIPAIAVFVILTFMFARYPLLDRIQCHSIATMTDADITLGLMYAEKTTNVEYSAENLHYTGFDYYVDGELSGAYYYTKVGGKYLMLLVKTDNPPMKIDEKLVKGRIKKDKLTADHIVTGFALESGMDPALVENMTSDYVISEPEYPYAYVIMIYVFFAMPAFVALIIVIYTLLVCIQPSMNTQARQLREYGDPAEVIAEINSEMRRKLLFRKNNIYVTENYLVVSYLSKTDAIKLDEVQYISKNEVERKKAFRRSPVYRLTLSTPGRIFYEVDFSNESLIDDVIFHIENE